MAALGIVRRVTNVRLEGAKLTIRFSPTQVCFAAALAGQNANLIDPRKLGVVAVGGEPSRFQPIQICGANSRRYQFDASPLRKIKAR